MKDKTPQMRRGQGHILPQLYLCKIGEARHFKVRVLIDTEEYEYDVLLPKWMCSVM